MPGRLAVHRAQHRDLGRRSIDAERGGDGRVEVVGRRRPREGGVAGHGGQHARLDLPEVGADEDVAGFGGDGRSQVGGQAVQPGRRRHPPRRTVASRSTAPRRRPSSRRARRASRSRRSSPYARSRRHVSSASTTGWASRTCSSRHALVSGTSTPTRRSSDRTWAGLRRSATAPAGAWRSTVGVARRALGDGVGGRAGRGPTMAPMIPSARRDRRATRRDRARRTAPRPPTRRAPSPAPAGGSRPGRQLRLLGGRHLARQLGPRRGVRRPTTPTRRPATPGAGGRRCRSARRARRASGPGRRGRVAAPGAPSPDRGRGRAPTRAPGRPATRRGAARCTAARSKARAIATSAEHGADRRRRPPHPAWPVRRLDVAHVGHVDRLRGRPRHATCRWPASPRGRPGSPRPAGVTRARAARGRRRPGRRAGCSRRRWTRGARRG